ncbi:MAG: hypothetical protein KC910_27000 [Candidatus Eremiobacteraeota bacterium]|nr:hypothetical protein [Candidatus Eremiobacteraeota bacterium]
MRHEQMLQQVLGSQSRQAGSQAPGDPQIAALPPALAQLLDGLANGRPANSWQDWKAQLERELAQFTLNEAEAERLRLALAQLELLDQSILGAQARPATEAAFILFRELNRFRGLRESNRQSSIEPLNQLLVAGLAVLGGRAEVSLLDAFRDAAVTEVDRLVECFKAGESELPDEVRRAILTGIDRLGSGFAGLAGDDLEAALRQLAQGGSLLAHLQNWEREVEQAQHGCVPVVGQHLQELLAQLEEGPADPQLLADWSQHHWPALAEFWKHNRDRLLVDLTGRGQLLPRIDQALERLGGLESAVPSAQVRLLEELEGLFAELAEHPLDLSPLDNNPHRWMGDLALAALADGVPAFHLAATAEALERDGISEFGQAFKDHLRGDSRPLVDALEAYLGRS